MNASISLKSTKLGNRFSKSVDWIISLMKPLSLKEGVQLGL
jgi:hypothetical protein